LKRKNTQRKELKELAPQEEKELPFHSHLRSEMAVTLRKEMEAPSPHCTGGAQGTEGKTLGDGGKDQGMDEKD